VNLLPAFDTFLLAHAEKDHLVEKKYYQRVYRSLGQISPVVLVDGRIAGIWRTAPGRGKRFTACVELFVNSTRALRARIEEQAERHAKFLGLQPEVQFLRR